MVGEKLKDIALRQLQHLMRDQVRRAGREAVMHWKFRMQNERRLCDQSVSRQRMEAALEAQKTEMQVIQQATALAQLQRVALRLELSAGKLLRLWRHTMMAEFKLKQATMRAALLARVGDARSAAGLRQLQHTWLRLTKGELGLAVDRWRRGARQAVLTAAEAAEAAVLRATVAGRRGQALYTPL